MNSLSTYSSLNISNLQSTSTTIFNNLNALSTYSYLNISNVQTTSTTIFNNLNNLSTNTTLNLNNLSTNTTLNLNNLSTNTTLNLNNLSTNTTLNLNNLSTNTTLNLNNLSTNSILSINNLNATSTTLLQYINNLTNPSTLNTNNLNVSGISVFNNASTHISSLNVSGFSTFNNASTYLSTLNVVSKTTLQDCQIRGISTFPVNGWIIDSSSNQRIYFDNGAKTYFRSAGTTASPALDGFIFRNGQAGADLLNIDGSSNISCFGTLNVSGTTKLLSSLTSSGGLITNTINNSLISYVYPTPYNNGSTSTNQANSYTNLCVSTTAGFGVVFPYLSVVCSDIANNLGTKIYLSSAGTYWTGYNFNTRIILDSSFATNSGFSSGGSLYFQTSDTNNVNAGTYKNMCSMTSSGIYLSGNIGINNGVPQSYLHIGNCDVAGSSPLIIFGKRLSNNSGVRNALMGYTDTFYFVIGDYGNTNAGPNTLVQQLAIIFNAPSLSIIVDSTGYVRMQYGYGQSSDERLKTNIKTIENALDKTLLLRGIEYNDIRIEPDRKQIGLIAQEVELIVPEVVRTSTDDGIKSLQYQNLVGLLVEAIKELNNKVTNLENILKNNNLI